MESCPADIFSEPADVDPDTLRNLGPLRRVAGIWEGVRGDDVNPSLDGTRRQSVIGRMELQPLGPSDRPCSILSNRCLKADCSVSIIC